MAGKLGLAAKLFLGTTVLAGGGAGTWYATTNGLPSLAALVPAGAAADPGAEGAASAEAAPPAAADLDAVASAWGEPAAAHSASTEDSSPVARSAEVAPANGEKISENNTTKEPQPTSRYAVTEPAAEMKVAPAEAEPTEALPVESATVAKQGAAQPTPEIEPQDVAAESPDTTAAAKAVAETSVARGQEPNDEPELRALTGDNGTESQSLNTAGKKRTSNVLRSPPAAVAGNRYGGDASNSFAAADGGKSDIVNPFSSGGGTSSAQSAPANQTIEPLPGPPTDVEGGLTELQQTNDAQPLRPMVETKRTPETARLGNIRDASPISDRTTPSSDFAGALPPDNDRLPSSSLGASASAEREGAGRPGEKALEGPQKPSLEIQKFAPGEIQVGKPAKFVVRVRNIGGQAADGVSIQDFVPEGTKLVSTTPEAQHAGGQLLWDLGKLSPGEDRTVEMQVMPVTEGEIGSVATVSYSAHASVKTKCTMPQLAIRMTSPAKVMIGQEQRVKIELRNPGSGDATGVMLFENVPQNVKHASGPALEFDIGTLKAGETRELELVLMAEKAGKTVNVLSARADGNLQVQQQVEFEVIAPGLTVAVDGPERRYLERPATYEVSVENPGTAPAHDVKIVTKLPKGLRFIRANNMGEYDAATHAVYWSLAELPEGERGTVELVAMPIEAGPQTLEVESKAGQGLSDQTQRQIVIDGLAAIMFEVKDLEDPIEVGGETGYEIRVVNQGTKAATNVRVSVNLPPGMQLVSAEGETQHAEQRGSIVFEPLGQLAPKADTVYRIRAQGTTAGDQRVTVQVNTEDLAQPIRREESTLVYGDE